MKNTIFRLQNSNIKSQFLLSALSLLLYGYTSMLLDTSYVASKFPVPYFIGQTSFDDGKIKAWYQVMIQAGTFNIYFQTQLLDFLFILSVILGGFFTWTFVANLHSHSAFFRKWGYTFAFSLPLAGLFDILENFVSFFMMANPLNFSEYLAIIYSTLAAIKFGFWAIGLVWLILSLTFLLISEVKKIFKKLSPA